ncbi:MAG TPA: carboxypeptidase-like regulatory domain-containing protein, partial [Vicinamibacterales bacterium]|nr:carboxypeptidase-like regulatory domain-containing protein [Vicinamibacterales bacterium]
DRSRVAHAEVGAELTAWLTARSGVEYRDALDASDSPLTYHSLSARVGENRILAASISPGALARISGEWLFASRGHLSATVIRYGDEPRLNPSHLASEWDGNGSVSMRVGSAPLTLRFAGGERAAEDGIRTKRVEGEAIAAIGPFTPSVGYRVGAAAPQGELRATSLLFLGHGVPTPVRNAVLRASIARPRRSGGTHGHVEVGALTPLGSGGRLGLTYRYVPESRSSQLETWLQVDARSGRATTTHRRVDGVAAWSQTIAGSIAIDPHRGGVALSGRPLVGRGGASLRFFLDENGNNRWDRGELPIAGAAARFDRMAELRTRQAGEVLATELLAYHRYYVQVETRAVLNPLWRPQFTSFSFVADPNRFQAIDIPFHAAATVQGTVTRGGDNSGRVVPGLRVHVMSVDGSLVDMIPTFADGSFYHEGLPPGRYVVRLDPAQLDILAVTSSPAERTFDVRPGRDGASVEGLDFVLLPRARGP